MTIRARVRGIYTTNMGDLAQYVPEPSKSFSVWVRAIVGPEGGDGEGSFDVNVCTPRWLAELCRKEGFVVGRHHLVVEQYNIARLRQLITELIERCEGDSWQDVAEKVGRIGYWEFEDYKAAPQSQQ